MIHLPLDNVFVVYVAVPLIVTALLALYYNVRSRHRPTRERESIYECDQCAHVYAIARNRPMDRCPRCGHLNEAVRT